MKRENLLIQKNKLLGIIASMLAIFAVQYLHFKIAEAYEVSIEQVQAQDPRFTLDPLNIDKQWSLAAAGFPRAWEKTLGSTSTIVAIIDTGIDETHEDLAAGNFAEGYDFISNQPIPGASDSDDNGHGTLVAGIIGAEVNNGKGISGSNWRITLMPIKALDGQGRGDTATVAKAIIWAADHKANIINLSLGGSGFEHDADLAKAISYAFNRGLLIIAAAGNDAADSARNLDEHPVFPVCNDNNQNMVMGVTALDQNNIKPDFANFGKNCIDVAAPGRRILSTINVDPVSKTPTHSGYAYVSGTSMAAAFVSGQAALIKAMYPHALNSQIRDRIISTAKNVDNINLAQCESRSCKGLLGTGLIDVPASLAGEFSVPDALEGDVIRPENEPSMYWIHGGQKRLISPMVFNQRFIDSVVKVLPAEKVQKIPTGPFATPFEGTLVKTLNNATIYQISNGLKLPITYQIFKQRGYSFSEVKIAEGLETDSWVTGKFLAPKEGTLVKTSNSSQLFWTISGSLHKINAEFFKDRGLKIFPILTVTQKDLMSYNIGEAYIR